jgi:hypothetical protein
MVGYCDIGRNGVASGVSDALLLDEPYAGLDADLRRSLTELVHAREVPAVFVAHELAEAQAFADMHPERVAPARIPARGVVMTGMVTGCRPYSAGWEADLAIGAAAITCRLHERPAEAGGELVVTAIDPPWFGPDGTAIGRPDAAPVPRGPARAGR